MERNQVVCPRCGEIKLETPPGTVVLPTLGMARKAAGAQDVCDCGRRSFAAQDPPGADAAGVSAADAATPRDGHA